MNKGAWTNNTLLIIKCMAIYPDLRSMFYININLSGSCIYRKINSKLLRVFSVIQVKNKTVLPWEIKDLVCERIVSFHFPQLSKVFRDRGGILKHASFSTCTNGSVPTHLLEVIQVLHRACDRMSNMGSLLQSCDDIVKMTTSPPVTFGDTWCSLPFCI